MNAREVAFQRVALPLALRRWREDLVARKTRMATDMLCLGRKPQEVNTAVEVFGAACLKELAPLAEALKIPLYKENGTDNADQKGINL